MASPELLLNSTIMGAAAGALWWNFRHAAAGVLSVIEADVAEKLRAMRISTKRLRTYLGLWVWLMAAVLFGFWVGYGSLIFGLLGVVLMGPLPWYLLRRMAFLRRQKIEDQLAGSMSTLSGAIRAGLSLAQALEILAEQSPRPISLEFQHIVGQYAMGKTLEQTLTEAEKRLASDNFSMFAAAMLASRESGGRLNETVERIAQSVREFQRLERKVDSETAQARKSAVYMALAPPVILAIYYLIDPINTTRLFVTLPGQIMLSTAVVLNVTAWLWAKRLLTPNI